MAYSAYQEWLFEKVCYLREVEKLTFDAIAKRITSEGFKSARGFQFIAESAFSTYKKGTHADELGAGCIDDGGVAQKAKGLSDHPFGSGQPIWQR